ncbi:MAG: hypothetical protein Q7T29_09280 [Gallionella sp.]|nr:hypothetical protein [Gallionella sp.]
MSTNRNLQATKLKLERMELEHLRRHALELHEQLEQAKAEAERAWESAEFWQRHAMQLQEALHDGEFATHRSVGITRSGELMVVQTGGNHVESSQH